MSETVPQWFMFETSCYAFGGRIRRFTKLNVNKVNSNAILLIRLYLTIDDEFSQLKILISSCSCTRVIVRLSFFSKSLKFKRVVLLVLITFCV